MNRLVIATWNIQGMAGQWRRRKASLVRALAELDPDVVALQECAWRLRHQSMQIAKPLGMRSARAGTLGTLTRRIQSSRNHPMPARARGGSKRFLRSDIGSLHVVNVHMPLDAGVRVGYAREIINIASDRTALVVCGDFNERPDGAAVSLLRNAGFVDAWTGDGGETWPLPHRKARIDFVLLWGDVVAERAELIRPEPRASDHLGLVVEARTP